MTISNEEEISYKDKLEKELFELQNENKRLFKHYILYKIFIIYIAIFFIISLSATSFIPILLFGNNIFSYILSIIFFGTYIYLLSQANSDFSNKEGVVKRYEENKKDIYFIKSQLDYKNKS